MSLSKAEGQRKLSQILTDKRKKDPIGLLRAQRNGTLNEYLREDLAKHGLAVAGSTPAAAPTSSCAAESPPTQGSSSTAAPRATAAAGYSSPSAPGQRPESYRGPSAATTAASSSAQGSTGGVTPAAAKPRAKLASLGPIDVPSPLTPPPPPYQEHLHYQHEQKQQQQQQQQRREQEKPVEFSFASGGSSEPRRAPGKLSASRFGSFRGAGGSGSGSSGGIGVGGGRSAGGLEGAKRGSSPVRAKEKYEEGEEQEQDRGGHVVPPEAEEGGEEEPSSTPPRVAKSPGRGPAQSRNGEGGGSSHGGGGGSPRRWTVGPVSSPPTNSCAAAEAEEQGEKEETSPGSETPSKVDARPQAAAAVAGRGAAVSEEVSEKRGRAQVEESCSSAGGGLVETFEGGLSLRNGAASSPSRGGGRASGNGVGKRGTSGRIAELARRFEK